MEENNRMPADEAQSSTPRARGWGTESVERDRFDERLTFRLFEKEFSKAEVVVRYAEDVEGCRKYESVSHFARCAFVERLRAEYPLVRARGRPRKRKGGV